MEGIGLSRSMSLSRRIFMMHYILGKEWKKVNQQLTQNEHDIVVLYKNLSEEQKLAELARLEHELYHSKKTSGSAIGLN